MNHDQHDQTGIWSLLIQEITGQNFAEFLKNKESKFKILPYDQKVIANQIWM